MSVGIICGRWVLHGKAFDELTPNESACLAEFIKSPKVSPRHSKTSRLKKVIEWAKMQTENE